MYQQEMNNNFYIEIQKQIRTLALNAMRISYGEVLNNLIIIKERVMWSNWGLQGYQTKKALMVYLDTIYNKLIEEKKGFRFSTIYLFDKDVKNTRKNLCNIYNLEFRE